MINKAQRPNMQLRRMFGLCALLIDGYGYSSTAAVTE
jgi:hypothetical protein